MRKTIKQLQGESDYWRVKFINEQQRAEAAEAKSERWKEEAIKANEESEVVLAKLAELEKQDITGWRAVQNDNRDLREPLYLDGFNEPTGWNSEYAPVYSHPAPSADLAELVPGEWTERVYSDEELGYERGWNDCRAAILRNIEEAK